MADDDNSVLAGLEPFEWSNDRSVAYEVAIEVIGQAMACYTALIDREQRGANRDELIQAWEAAQTECSRLRRELDFFDDAAVERARTDYAALVKRLRQDLAE